MFAEPPYGFTQTQHNIGSSPVVSTSAGKAIYAGNPAYTKSAYSAGEIFASTNFDVQWIWLVIVGTGVAATQTDSVLDIGIGASGSEVTIISNLLCGWRAGAGYQGTGISVPMFIPKGTRIAARAQSITAAKTIRVVMYLYGGNPNPMFPLCYGIDDYGINLSSAAQGTSHTCGNSGAYSSWANIGSTTTKAYKGLFVIPQGTMTNTNMTNTAYFWEVGFGSTTLGKWQQEQNSSEQCAGQGPYPPIFAYTPVPIGTQLQVRGSCGATAQAIDVGVYGLY